MDNNVKRPSNTAERLRLLMEERGLRQVDILRLAEPYCKRYRTQLSKSDLSQFISGKVEPKQGKLLILGHALGVNPGWLMGLDIPREWTPPEELAKEEARLLSAYRRLRAKDRQYVTMMIERLSEDEEG